jgi:type II secretory pathway component PulF
MPADRDLAVFYRSLAEMLRAGLVTSGALEACAHVLPEATPAARIVEQGRPLSAALARFPRTFPPDHLKLLQTAEQCGSVDATLGDLADYADEMIAARRTFMSGLALPAFVLHVAVFLGPLPALVLGRIGFDRYLVATLGPLALIWGAVAGCAVLARRATPAQLDALLQRIPIVADAWRDLQRWRTAGVLRMLARTSLDVPASLRLAASVCADMHVSTALRRAADSTEQTGTPASTAIQTSAVLPPDVIALWRNAEMTGTHEAMFGRIAARYAESFRHRAQQLAAWMPRFIYALVAVGAVLQIFQLAGAYLGYLVGVSR